MKYRKIAKLNYTEIDFDHYLYEFQERTNTEIKLYERKRGREREIERSKGITSETIKTAEMRSLDL